MAHSAGKFPPLQFTLHDDPESSVPPPAPGAAAVSSTSLAPEKLRSAIFALARHFHELKNRPEPGKLH
jgi:hypothetical protein